MRRQALLDRLLCVVLGILSLADMLKELQQKLKQKFRSLFQRKVQVAVFKDDMDISVSVWME